jgi:hypothetical protein
MAKASPSKAAPQQTAVAVAAKKAVGPAFDFGADAGAGFEGAGREAYAIPFLVILQSGSPQCKRSDGAYIKGAEEGMILNTVTNELFNEPVDVIPCAYTQTFIEWGLREQGGGFIAEYDNAAGQALKSNARRDDKNRDILPNGHQLNDTRNHYVLFKDGEGYWQTAMMSMHSTQIKSSRNWMTAMQNLATVHKAPMYALVFKVGTSAQSNDKGTWYGYTFTFDHLVTEEEDAEDVYEKAKAFWQSARSGQVKTQSRDAESGTAAGDNDDDTPF